MIKNLLRKTTSFSKGFTTFSSHERGFTLIELLIVIAILGVLAAGILVVIDPVDKVNSANDSKVQNDVSAMGRSSEAYAAFHNGFYPATLIDLETAGELKKVPVAPGGYSAYAVVNTPAGCTAGKTCTGIVIWGQLKSKKYTSVLRSTWQYESTTGKSCAIALRAPPLTNDCP